MRVASVGHAVFAATVVALGILGLIKGDFAALWQPVPQGVPGREALAYLCAFISLTAGIRLLWQRAAAPAARLLLLPKWYLLRPPTAAMLSPSKLQSRYSSMYSSGAANYFPLGYNATTGALVNLFNFREQLTLSPSGDSFTGTFTLDVYDTKGNHVDHVGGNVTATRVTVDTKVTAAP
jgi:hypothetical protein